MYYREELIIFDNLKSTAKLLIYSLLEGYTSKFCHSTILCNKSRCNVATRVIFMFLKLLNRVKLRYT